MHEFQDPAAREVVAHVLDTHPEGQSLLAEAGHRRMLAEQSARVAMEAFAMAKAARLGYEALRHRLDPRYGRTIHVGIASVAVAAVIAALLGLDRVEFAGVLAGWMTTAAAATATAAWAGFAWLAALAVREERRGRLTAIAAGAAAAGLLLAALHGVGSLAFRWQGWRPVWVSVLVVLVILALVTIATEIITRTEPASLLLARRRWHRARGEYLAAVRVERSDAQAAAVAAQEWCSLIDVSATAYAASGAGAGRPPSGNGHVTPDPWAGASPM
ncbi:MAG: hypothetical protein ACLP5E_05405 [Streptosporangiaceae bacterium]